MPIIPHMYRSPWRRPSTDTVPEPDADAAPDLDPAEVADDPDLDEDEDEPQLDDAAFYRSLRRDVDRLREGLGRSIVDAMPELPKDRPHSKRWRPRDRYGNRIY